jgi:uncharacterized membrane protein
MALSTRLKKIPLFSGLGEDERVYLARALTPRRLGPLEPLFWVGDSGNDMFFIERGRLEICIPDLDGREIRLAVLGPGDFVGEISLLDGGARTATARAVGEVELLALNRADFHHCITRFPEVALKVVTILSERQRSTVEKLRGIRNLNEVLDQNLTRWQRLANAIADLAASQAFLMVHAIAMGAWLVINTSLSKDRAPDPFPFPFLCFWASVEAIFLSLFILISQSQQSQKDRLRNEVEYQIALKLQLEMMQLHRKMDEQSAILAQREEQNSGALSA